MIYSGARPTSEGQGKGEQSHGGITLSLNCRRIGNLLVVIWKGKLEDGTKGQSQSISLDGSMICPRFEATSLLLPCGVHKANDTSLSCSCERETGSTIQCGANGVMPVPHSRSGVVGMRNAIQIPLLQRGQLRPLLGD